MFLIVISKKIWGDAFCHQKKVPPEFPRFSPKKGTLGNVSPGVSPSWEREGARKCVPHPGECIPVEHCKN